MCGNSVADTRDGKSYSTVLIGTQCWFAQNLNVGTRINGSVEQSNNGIIEKYCYNDLESNCTIYCGLYEWAEIVQYLNGTSNTTTWNPVPAGNVTGLCPAGWHLPKYSEWTTLITYLGGEFIAGGKMKETGNAHWYYPNTGANNLSGFTALPGGERGTSGTLFLRSGMVMIRRIALSTGNLGVTTIIPFPFPEKIKLYKGEAFFLCKESGNNENWKLLKCNIR